MDIFNFFENVVYPRVIKKFGVVQVDFEKEGDFGYLTRFDLYSNKKTATIELWSSRWVGLEIYKLENRDIDIIYNKMISPDEVSEEDFFAFMEVLFNGN